MRANYLFQALVSIMLICMCHVARAEPLLNGIGVHQELGQEVFIGALYSESLSNDAKTLLKSAQPMRMELKVVAPDGLTTRRFSRMWIEGMAVNSRADVLTAQADNMVKFDGLFRGRFQKNDAITFTNNPGSGVDIAVNNVLLGTITDNTFFSMLLSTWIGRIPLSSDFRDALLKVGDVDNGLRGRYSAIAATAARTAEITAWTGPQVEVKTAAASSSKSSAKAKVETAVAVETEAPAFDMPAIEKPRLDISIPKSQAKESSSSTVVAVTSSSAAKTVAATQTLDDDEDGPALTAQTLLARQFFVSDAIKKIRSNTRYPQRALDRGQSGSVRVAVVIDRNGNVLSTKLLESSKFNLLNKEALAALKRSAPFPSLPAEINGARFEFTVPMRWALPD